MLIRPVRSYLCFRENLNYPTAARNHSGKSRIEVCKSYEKTLLAILILFSAFYASAQDRGSWGIGPKINLYTHTGRGAVFGIGGYFRYSLTDALRLKRDRHSLQIGMFGGHRVRRPLSLPHNRTMEPLPHSRRQCERLGQMVLRLRCGRRLRLPDHPPLEYIAHVQIPFPDSHVRTESDPDLPGRNFHILTEKHGVYRHSDLRFKCFGIADCTCPPSLPKRAYWNNEGSDRIQERGRPKQNKVSAPETNPV